jgi:hypothetical protein
MTQAGFVRVVSNPAFSRRAISPQDALAVLQGSLKHRAHHLWAEDIGLAEAVTQFGHRLIGHQQVTDGYLLGLTIHKKGRLATLDSNLASLLPEGSGLKDRLILI